MNISVIIFIALALAMDAFAVSVASGVNIRNFKIKHAFTIATWFGIFQGVMPLIGWFAGIKLYEIIKGIDHWIVFFILLFIGCKMIYESFKLEPIEKAHNPLQIKVLFILSIATSIDALATGISFAMLNIFIITPVLIIGIITFITSFVGVLIGTKAGHVFEDKIEIIGGIILITIGTKILLSHILQI